MVGSKVVHHVMMRGADGHYVGGLVNGARIVDMWGDVGTELMVYVDGDISLFLGYKNIKLQLLYMLATLWNIMAGLKKLAISHTHAISRLGKLLQCLTEQMLI